jgi:rhodanese-related sulfurtransferase
MSVGSALACHDGLSSQAMGSDNDQYAMASQAMAAGVPVKAPAEVQPKPIEAKVSTDALQILLRCNVPLTVLDARSGKYDDGKRIPGAVALNAGNTDEEIAKVLPDKGALVVTYCASLKCGASHKLAERLIKLGYLNIVEYPEGIAGWIKGGNKIIEVKN